MKARRFASIISPAAGSTMRMRQGRLLPVAFARVASEALAGDTDRLQAVAPLKVDGEQPRYVGFKKSRHDLDFPVL